MAKLKCGLIQMALKGDTSMSPENIRGKMLDAHVPFIEEAGRQGVQVLCSQEVFTQPYFCPSQMPSGTARPRPFPTALPPS